MASSQAPTAFSPPIPTTGTSPFALPPRAKGEGNFAHDPSSCERRLDVCH